MIIDEWTGCYKARWKGVLTDASMRHPAKFSCGLIGRIYRHAQEEGWISAGAKIIDPFGGVATGAHDAMLRGLDWYGIELEPHFVELGQGNIALWTRRYTGKLPNYGRAILLQGDSRRLLEVLKERDAAVAVISSPPYAQARIQQIGSSNADNMRRSSSNGVYGTGNGQLAGMPEGDIDGLISSPPYAQSLKKPNGIDGSKIKNPGGPNSQSILDPRYGQSAGQLGEMPTGQFSAAISSPPFLQSSGGVNVTQTEGPLADPRLHERHSAGNKSAHSYGESAGQLSGLKDDGFDAAISSPPYEDSLSRDTVDADARRAYAREHGISNVANVTIVEMGRIGARDQEYGDTPGQIGSDSGETFWSAAAQIVAQCYQALAPGAHAIWVVKGYVKDKKLVDFPGQWRALCESVGFVTLHEHRAMLVERRGTSLTLDGEEIHHEVSRKSFFRRLVESKGAPRLDYETVYCMVKPEKGEAC